MSRPDHTKIEAGFFDCRTFRDIGDDWQTQTVRAVLAAGPGSRMTGVQRLQESSLRIVLANMSAEELRRSLTRLEEVGFIVRDGDWLWIPDKADVNIQFSAESKPGMLIGGMVRAWSEVADCSSRRIVQAFIGRYGAHFRLGLVESQQPIIWARLVSALDGSDPLAYVRAPAHASVPVRPLAHPGMPDAHAHTPTHAGMRHTHRGQTDRQTEADRHARMPAHEGPAGDATHLQGVGRPDVPKTSASVGSGPTTAPDANHGADPFDPPGWAPGDEPPAERRVTVDGVLYVERFIGSSRSEWLETVGYRRQRNGRLMAHDVVAAGYGGAAWVRMAPPTLRVVEVRHVYASPDEGAAPSWDADARRRAWSTHPDNSDRVTVPVELAAL